VKVFLYRVGRNLNRAIRTCEAFGVKEIGLIECKGSYLKGNLFSAKGKVELKTLSEIPPMNILALETFFPTALWEVDWREIDGAFIGGETEGLPRRTVATVRGRIPQPGRTPLTVEAALAIALYEWQRYLHQTA
jgi:tRNA G18 (ribose-2'-O)-methylase SpoU